MQLAKVLDWETETFTLELRCHHRPSDTVWVSLHCQLLLNQHQPRHLILQVHGTLPLAGRARRKLQELAFSDTVMACQNNRRFQELRHQAVARCIGRPRGSALQSLFLDFDRLPINDSLGH